MAFRYIHESKSDKKNIFFDWWGAITLGSMLSTLVLVLDKGADWGGMFASTSMLCYAIVIVLFVLFIKIEQKAKEPIVDLNMFKIPAFVNTLVNNFVVFMGMMGALFLVPVFAQTFLGFNATESGYLFMPMAAALMLGSPIGGALLGKVESKYVIFWSTIVAAIGIYMFSFLDAKSTSIDIMLPLCVMAFGLGFGMAQRTSLIASLVPESEIGVASSILALVRNISGAFGIAIFGTILTNRIGYNIFTINSYSVLNSHVPVDIKKYIALVELKAQIDAYNFVFLIATLLVFVGAFAILFLKVKNERTDIHVTVE